MNTGLELEKGKVSIVVASYNHAGYLTERMESLINQSYQNIEIIVIDDKSPDDSLKVLSKYENHPKVKILASQVNQGWIGVSNQGLNMATGEFVIFANCDDSCSTDQIEKYVNAFSSNDVCAVFSRSTMIDENGKNIGNDFDGREKSFKNYCSVDTFIPADVMSKFLLHSCVIPNLSGVLFRTSLLKEIGGLAPEYKVCSDWELFLKLALKHNFYYLTEELNFFRQHKTTIRKTTKDRITYDEFYRLICEYIYKLKLSQLDNLKYSFRVATIWSQHLSSLNPSSFQNFFYHLKQNLNYNPKVVLLLIPALGFEFFHKLYRVLRKISSSRNNELSRN